MTPKPDTTIKLRDLTVSRVGLGAMRLSGAPSDRAESIRTLRHAVDLGIDFLDTADSYDLGGNEQLIAEALHPYPESLVIATKAGRANPTPSEWIDLGRPEYLRQQTELSLRRLRLERIDLFQLHRIDAKVPLEDQIGALRQLQDEGKVRHVGLSEVSVEQLEATRSMIDVVSVQNLYNVAKRRHEDVLDYCEKAEIAFIPWLPIGGGPVDHPHVREVAAEVGASPTQVALAWLLHRSPAVLPIPGTSSRRHLEENAAALTLGLSTEQYERIG